MTQLSTDSLIVLYQLDTTMLGGQMFYFSSATDFDTSIFLGGQEYVPLPMDAQGFEMSTKGAPAQPTVTISNIYGAGNLLIDSYKGLVGALLIRIITLRRFLDDGTTPDPNAYITRDKYAVAQKTSHTALAIIFKLATILDQQGLMIPRRTILRDVCSHQYRVWNPDIGWFDYSKASCPYSGGAFYDYNNYPTDAPHDLCSRNVQGCKLRFPNQALPARFFPGVGKVT
jgi:lambda family phage minor tail protein L